MKKIVLVNIERLKGHEEVRPDYLEELKKEIQRDGMLKMPIAVDKKTYVILDGHHRLHALRKLGCKKIPVILLNYGSPSIKVQAWREGDQVTKEMVVRAALSGRRMRSKTTKHMVSLMGKLEHISVIQTVINIPLERLK